MIAKKRQRQRQHTQSLWSWMAIRVLRILLSPLVVLYGVIIGQRRVPSAWVRAFLLHGLVLLVTFTVMVMVNRVSTEKVFAALGRFDLNSAGIPAGQDYSEEINAAASRYDLNPLALSFVIQLESGGRPWLISSKGARGLMQIMPETWRSLNNNSSCKGNHQPPLCDAGDECIFAPWANIRMGALFLSQLLEKYDGDFLQALQAYNAGQRNVVSSPRAKFDETREYIASFLHLSSQVREEDLHLRLAASVRTRRWLQPLLAALAVYMVILLVFFWRRHRWVT